MVDTRYRDGHVCTFD